MAESIPQFQAGSWSEYLKAQMQADEEIRLHLRKATAKATRIMNNFPDNTVAQQIRSTQYMLRRKALKQMQADLWGDVGETIDQGIDTMEQLSLDQGIDFAELLTSGVPASQGGAAEATQFQEAAKSAMQNLQSSLTNKIDLSDLVYKNEALATGKIDRIVNNGILLGQSAKEIADGVIKYIRPDVPGGASFAAMRLGRTELNNAFHNTTRKRFEEEPWVEMVNWRTSGSHPRPDICNELEARSPFKPREVPAKPHPQCLCYIVAATPTREQFVKKLNNGEYDEWMEGQLPEMEMSRPAGGWPMTADDLKRDRQNGLTWMQITKKYDLGDRPYAARRAWYELTGTRAHQAPGGRGPQPRKKVEPKPKPKPQPKPVLQPTLPPMPTPPPVSTEWVDASSVQEARKQLSTKMEQTNKLVGRDPYKRGVAFKTNDLNAANMVGRTMSDLLDKYPNIMSEMEEVEITGIGKNIYGQAQRANITGFSSRMNRGGLGYGYGPHPGWIHISSGYCNDYRMFEKHIARDYRSHWASHSKPDGVVQHEFGHHLDFIHDKGNLAYGDQRKRLISIMDEAGIQKNQQEQIINWMSGAYGDEARFPLSYSGKASKWLTHDVSEYAKTNPKEFMAECFSGVESGERVTPLTKMMHEHLTDRMAPTQKMRESDVDFYKRISSGTGGKKKVEAEVLGPDPARWDAKGNLIYPYIKGTPAQWKKFARQEHVSVAEAKKMFDVGIPAERFPNSKAKVTWVDEFGKKSAGPSTKKVPEKFLKPSKGPQKPTPGHPMQHGEQPTKWIKGTPKQWDEFCDWMGYEDKAEAWADGYHEIPVFASQGPKYSKTGATNPKNIRLGPKTLTKDVTSKPGPGMFKDDYVSANNWMEDNMPNLKRKASGLDNDAMDIWMTTTKGINGLLREEIFDSAHATAKMFESMEYLDFDPDDVPFIRKCISHLDTMMSNSKVPQDIVGYRTFIKSYDTNKIRKDLIAGLKKDGKAIIRDPGFTATSLVNTPPALSGEANFLMVVDIPKGSRALGLGPISEMEQEAELLLDRGGALEVLKVHFLLDK